MSTNPDKVKEPGSDKEYAAKKRNNFQMKANKWANNIVAAQKQYTKCEH
jgi:hypothetical protein